MNSWSIFDEGRRNFDKGFRLIYPGSSSARTTCTLYIELSTTTRDGHHALSHILWKLLFSTDRKLREQPTISRVDGSWLRQALSAYAFDG